MCNVSKYLFTSKPTHKSIQPHITALILFDDNLCLTTVFVIKNVTLSRKATPLQLTSVYADFKKIFFNTAVNKIN